MVLGLAQAPTYPILYVNLAFEQATGYTLAEVVGCSGRFLQKEPETPTAINTWQTALQAGRSCVVTLQTYRKDGSTFWAEVQVTPLPDAFGQVSHFMEVQLDITARQEAEAAWQTQHNLFENLVAVARATTADPDLDATLQRALNIACRLTDADRGSLILLDPNGQVTHSLLLRGQTAPLEKKRLLSMVLEQGLAGWIAQHLQGVIIDDTSQDARWLQLPNQPYSASAVLGVPIVSGSTLVGLLILQHEQRGHFTDQHLALMQAAADQMALALRNAQINDAQRRLAERQTTLYEILRMLGQTLEPNVVAHRAVEAVARLKHWPCVTLFIIEEEQQHLKPLACTRTFVRPTISINNGVIGRAFCQGQMQWITDVTQDPDYVAYYSETQSELDIPLRRGERVFGVLNIESPERNAFSPEDVYWAESLAEAIALSLDNARLYAQSLQTAEHLLEVDKLKSAFIANMSHELRTPLLAIVGYTEVLLDQAQTRELTDFANDLRRVDKAAHHLTAIINDVLDLSKIEAGRMELAFDLVHIPSLVESVLANIHLLAEKQNNTLTVEYTTDLTTFTSDPKRVRQVLINLLSNAVKFTEHGQVSLQVGHEQIEGQNWLLFAVKDTGIGMTASQIAGLFKDFMQVDISSTRKYSGTGLGLSLSRRLCRLMGGDIAVTSALGVGSTFTVRLPTLPRLLHRLE